MLGCLNLKKKWKKDIHNRITKKGRKKTNTKKKHSENAINFTSFNFDLEMWPWPWHLPHIKVKKDYVIWCRSLHCILVPGMIVCRCDTLQDMAICSFFVTCDLHLWPSASVNFMLTIFDEKPYFMLTVMMDCRAQTLERRKLVKTWKNVLPVDAKVCRETYSKIMC